MSSKKPSERLTRALAQFPGPITLQSSRVKYAAWALFMGLLMALFAWSIWHSVQVQDRLHLVLSALAFMFVGLVAMFPLCALVMRSMCLTLDATGFQHRYVWFHKRRLWANVSGFTAGWLGSVPRVFYADSMRKLGSFDELMFGPNNNTFLQDTYGFSTSELAQLMNEWRARALDCGAAAAPKAAQYP